MSNDMSRKVWVTNAAAKLNLTLEVLGKRSDGYHNLASVAVSLDLADELRLTRQTDGRAVFYRDIAGRRVSIETADDIIQRAWSLLDAQIPLPGGATIEVTKRIPIASGLGGGSTDAAAFLRLARNAWDLPLSDADLIALGADVGSDVPCCLLGGPARMSGRGELVEPLQAPPPWSDDWAVLLHRPELPVPSEKTASMYRSLRSSDFRDGAATTAMVELLASGAAPSQDDCLNSFDAPAREVIRGLVPARRRMGMAIARAAHANDADAVTPMLAGAGPTLFAVLPPAIARSACEALRQQRSGFTAVTRPISRADATAVQSR